MKPARVRFAPSPTGDMHLGSARVALFNYLIARKTGGSFVLRIEDTDQERKVEGAVDRIYETLEWLGIHPDEGPHIRGAFGPYIQSERLPLYQDATKELLAKGAAYHCFCTPERLAELRAQQAAAKQPPRYDKKCLHLPADEMQKKLSASEPHVIRLHVPEQGSTSFTDLVRGTIVIDNKEIDDTVLLKSDGFPTYHLAVVVDDHAMNISLIVRGEEWIPSTPKHILLYHAFGWEIPEYAHAPLILAKDHSKLSKRHGSVSVQEFRTQGFLPEALVNYLALLGWNPGDEREIFTLEELERAFSLERVMKAGAVFDIEKLRWMNGKYIRELSPEVLAEKLSPYIPAIPESLDLAAAVRSVQDRLEALSDAAELMDFYFTPPQNIPAETLVHKKIDSEQALHGLLFAAKTLDAAWDGMAKAEQLKEFFFAEIEKAGLSTMQVLWPMRVALTGKKASPDVFDVAVALGKQETRTRVATAVATLQ